MYFLMFKLINLILCSVVKYSNTNFTVSGTSQYQMLLRPYFPWQYSYFGSLAHSRMVAWMREMNIAKYTAIVFESRVVGCSRNNTFLLCLFLRSLTNYRRKFLGTFNATRQLHVSTTYLRQFLREAVDLILDVVARRHGLST